MGGSLCKIPFSGCLVGNSQEYSDMCPTEIWNACVPNLPIREEYIELPVILKIAGTEPFPQFKSQLPG